MWHFNPAGALDTIRTPKNDEFFSSNHCEAVVREAVQNSLDATPNGSSLKTRVVFSFVTVKGAEFLSDLEEVKLHCASIDKHVPTGSEVKSLLIEDFNTTGLQGSIDKFAPKDERDSLYSFWWEEGSSHKKTGSGGSHGVGKSTLSSASQFNTFLALTRRTDDPFEALIGFCSLPPHELHEKQYLGYARYGALTKSGADKRLLPYTSSSKEGQAKIALFREHCEPIRGEESGLSVLVPWVHKDLTFGEIVKVVLKNFFLPIIKENLEVEVADRNSGSSVVLRKSNVIEVALEFFKGSGEGQELHSLMSGSNKGLPVKKRILQSFCRHSIDR